MPLRARCRDSLVASHVGGHVDSDVDVDGGDDAGDDAGDVAAARATRYAPGTAAKAPLATRTTVDGELRQLGGYDVVRPLSRGGMGAVLLAERRAHGITRRVAIKIIHPHLLSDAGARELFFAEAKLAARFTHPNLVPVIDFGEDSGVFYLVMELVEGQTLLQLLRAVRRPLPPALAARIAADAARGLAWAHALVDDDGKSLGVIHRDISPDNLFVTNVGAVKVLDFGIAKSRARVEATTVGSMRGKPGYMAPERFRQRAADDRVDVWSLGVVLHEMLAGARLFRAQGHDVLKDIEKKALPALPAMVPPELARVVADMLERNAEQRPRMAKVVERLDRLLLSWQVASTPDALRRAIDDVAPGAFGNLSTTDQVPLALEGRADGVETAAFTPARAAAGDDVNAAAVDDDDDVRAAAADRALPRQTGTRVVGDDVVRVATPVPAPAPPRAPRPTRAIAAGAAAALAVAALALLVAAPWATTTTNSTAANSTTPTPTPAPTPTPPPTPTPLPTPTPPPAAAPHDTPLRAKPRAPAPAPAPVAAKAGLFVADRTPYVEVYVDGTKVGVSPLGSKKQPFVVSAGSHAVRLVEPHSGKTVLQQRLEFAPEDTVVLRP